ncbi:hypothetical protein [Paraburkholderia sacchari]|uniref:hypothetical protein n=1 Tax=Paraburkholderia sacchari TaxID=159450 RepID=UPI001BCA6889|nr:hypothetical protein [Paraburkholderia sacchari]
MTIITKDQLLAELEPRIEEVSVKGLSQPLRVRIFNGHERDRLSARFSTLDGTDSAYYSAVVATCVVGEDGERYFSDDDLEMLREKNGELVIRIGLACLSVLGVGAAAVDTAEKNSAAIQRNCSGSGLPSSSENQSHA